MQLGEYNAAFLADDRYDYFGLFVRDEANAVRAGLVGNLYAGWPFINLLWVTAEFRRNGIDSFLIAEAERRALAFGCHSAHVNTFSFKGRIFTRSSAMKSSDSWIIHIDNKRIFLKKRLRAEEA